MYVISIEMTEIREINTPFGTVELITLSNASGASVVLSTLGAAIVEVNVPDRNGDMADVVLGYASVADYMADGPCAGKVPGRFANRIAGGHLVIGGAAYCLPVNNGPNHLHGGPEGFQNKIWNLVSAEGDTVVMRYRSADGEAGYPGNLVATATYRWTEDCELQLTLEAATDADTVVNLTNHAYWNLAGHNAGSALDQVLTLNASHYLPTDETLIPTGEVASVKGTPMDFTAGAKPSAGIAADFPAIRYGKGYDNCWVIDGWVPGKIQVAAELYDQANGRRLTVLTDQPGVQVYTGNWLAGSPVNKSGRSYDDYDGIAIECQGFPDAPNKSSFPSALLRPGEVYTRHIIFKFTVEK